MIGEIDTYYLRPEVSNSDLSELWKQFLPSEHAMDLAAAYRFGNLIDAMITEKHRVDFYNYRVDQEQFTEEEFSKAYKMLEAFRKDELCLRMMNQSSGQMVFTKELDINYEGFYFRLLMRCKYDLFMQALRYGGDIKSTTATSQKQFEDSILHFDYDRQRYEYMEISGAEKDVVIGISKVNFKVFKVFIKKGDPLWLSGKEKFERLAFKWWMIMDGLSITA